MTERAFEEGTPKDVLDLIATAQASRLEIDPGDPSHVALYLFEYGSVVERIEGSFSVTDEFDDQIFIELLLHPPAACTLRPGHEELLKEQIIIRLSIPEQKEAVIERLRQRRELIDEIRRAASSAEQDEL